MSRQVVTACEFGCILLIAVGVAFISWPVAIVLAGVLALVALQGFKATTHDIEERD